MSSNKQALLKKSEKTKFRTSLERIELLWKSEHFLFSRRERVLIKAKNNRCLRIIANMPKHTFALICNVHIHYQIIFESYYKFTEINFLT